MNTFVEKIKTTIEHAWYNEPFWINLLLPFSWVYNVIIYLRRSLYQSGILKRKKFDIPVIVVGNILVGGANKTPMVAYIASYLLDKDLKVGILSHGYKSKLTQFPHNVIKTDKAVDVGDEAYLLYEKLLCPVVVDPNRVRGIEYLIQQHHCNVVICDDGLQHLALEPSITIVLHPYQEIKSYTHCLPAGPLREPISQLEQYDIKVDTTKSSTEICHIAHFNFRILDKEGNVVDATTFKGIPTTVVTGIARPQRLMDSLASVGLNPVPKFFPDHYAFTSNDFETINTPIIMTQKDWVKCRDMNLKQEIYIADLEVVPCMMFRKQLDRLLDACI